MQQSGQQLARESDVAGALVGAPGGAQRGRGVSLLPGEQRRVAEGQGRLGPFRGAAGVGLERLAPGKATDRRGRGAAQGCVLVGEGPLGGQAAEGIPEAGVGLGQAGRRGEPAGPVEQSRAGRGGVEDGEPVEQVDDRRGVVGAQGGREAGLVGVQGARRQRARLLGVDPRGAGIAGREVECGEAQQERRALAGGSGRDEPEEAPTLRRLVPRRAGGGDQRRPGLAGIVLAEAGLEGGAQRRLPLRSESGGERRVAGQRQPERLVGLAPGGGPGRGEHGPGLVGGAGPGRARPSALAPGGVDESRDVGERPPRGGERRRQDVVERRGAGRRAARGDHEAPDGAGRRPELGRSGAGVEGGGEPLDLELQVDEGESIADRAGPQPDGHAPAFEPELEARRREKAVWREVLGQGGAILPRNAPPRGNRATSAGRPRPPGCDAR